MTVKEVQKILSTIQEQPFKRFVQFVLYTACCRNEILYVQREDLDLERGIIHVNSHKTRRRLALPINKALLRIITEMQDNNELPASGYPFSTDSPHVTKRGARLWNDHTPTHWFKKYVRKAKLDDTYSLHSCRHTYATYLDSKGVPREGYPATARSQVCIHYERLCPHQRPLFS